MIKGEKYSNKVDIWALGIIFYYIAKKIFFSFFFFLNLLFRRFLFEVKSFADLQKFIIYIYIYICSLRTHIYMYVL
jgi:serine/threonine protein kinase